MKKFLFFFFTFLIAFFCSVNHVDASDTFWSIQSIDTMKLSRDSVKDNSVNIAFWVSKVASLHANYIAIDTPYDEEFYPVLERWVTQARKNNLHVWFRGNFSGWEGWFNYPKLKNADQHYALTKAFISKHANLFKDGDIFTPAPEPENGIIGDPRSSNANSIAYNTFLVRSFSTCKNAMEQIHKHVSCGYFSMNGDIALNSLTQETADTLGVIVIDHYVSSVSQMGDEVDSLYQKFGKPVVLGEFGAPLDEINGQMDEIEQAGFISSILNELYVRKQEVEGLNYWVISGGSTALFQDDGTPKKVVNSITNYYNPLVITGVVKDTFGNQLANILIHTPVGNISTDSHGRYAFSMLQVANIPLTIEDSNYKPYTTALLANQNVVDITLQPTRTDIWYHIQLLIRNILQTINLS